MNDREKARDLGNQSANLARSIADVLNDTLDALAAAEGRVEAAEAERDEANERARLMVEAYEAADAETEAAEKERDKWRAVACNVKECAVRNEQLEAVLSRIKPLVTGQLPTPANYEMTMRCVQVANIIDAALAATGKEQT